MTQDEIIEMARQAGFDPHDMSSDFTCNLENINAFAKLVAEKKREVVANWIMDRGFATGHGDSIVDLLDQLEWQIAEKEREACAKLIESHGSTLANGFMLTEAIRARGQA